MEIQYVHYYAFLGWMIISAIIAVLWLISGMCGVALYKRLRRVYHFTVIGYWLDRIEKEGTHCFRKSDDIEG